MIDIAFRRLHLQQVTHQDFKKPGDVVAWLGCVQAQEWAHTKWAVGLRLPGKTSDSAIARAIDDGEIIRTHAMRWTWQLIAPEDVRWMIALLGPEGMRKATSRHRDLGLDARTILRSNAALAKGLSGANLTREEIGRVLKSARVSPEGQRLPHLIGCAELEGVICSGPRRGKQPTWTLLDERVPKTKPRDRAAALGELAWRYFQSRSPATAHDFRWWSGLSMPHARAAIEANSHRLESEKLDDRTLYFVPAPSTRTTSAYFLPMYDEMLVGYTHRDDMLDPKHVKKLNAGGGLLNPCIVHDGRVIGTWRRKLDRNSVGVTVSLFGRVTSAASAAIATAKERFLAFANA